MNNTPQTSRLVFLLSLLFVMTLSSAQLAFAQSESSEQDDHSVVSVNNLLIQVGQLKNETQYIVLDPKPKKKLLKKIKSANKHIRKSIKYTAQGKHNKATNQLRFIWNAIYAYQSLLHSAREEGGISAQTLTNLESRSLQLLDDVAPMGKNVVLQYISKLKIDTTAVVSHKKISKKLKKKLKSAFHYAKKAVKKANRDQKEKSKRLFIKAKGSINEYVARIEHVNSRGVITSDKIAPLLQQAELIKRILTLYIDGNQEPVANAGINQSVEALMTVTLDGSGSTDSDGTIISYNWMQLEGTDVVLSSEEIVSPSFTAPQVTNAEILVFQLAVVDDKGTADLATVQITIKPVIDTLAPVITLNGSNPLTHLRSELFIDPGATAIDNSDGTVNVAVTGTVDPLVVGTYTLTYNATDSAGNIASVKRTVNVVLPSDTKAPVITLNGSNPLTHTQGEIFTDPEATAIDDRDGDVATNTSGSVNSATLGSYTLTYTATDSSGNIATITRIVNVILPPDTTAPVITLNGERLITHNQDEVFTDLGASATDNRDGNIDVIDSGSVDTSTIGIYILTYTATDSAGNTATVIRTVNIIASPSTPFGVEISSVSGNTANFNGVAEFMVTLKSQPTHDVVIPVYSSNENEGKTDESSLTFTPDNWFDFQQVFVKGKNKNTLNGVQNYKIILGSIDSLDPNYHGHDPDDVPMKGLHLSTHATISEYRKVISGEASEIPVQVKYNGYNELTYTLKEAPTGMVFENNLIKWNAPASVQGKDVPVTIAVTDGTQNAEVSFLVTVAKGIPLQTEVNGKIMTVTDTTSNLEGISIEFISDNYSPDKFKLYKMDVATIPAIRADWPASTDVFYVESNTSELGKMVIRIPLEDKFSGKTWLTHDIELVHWSNGKGVTDVDGGLWIPNFLDYDIDYDVDPQGKATFMFNPPAFRLKGIFYFRVIKRGVPLGQLNIQPPLSVATLGARGASGGQGPVGAEEVTCDPRTSINPDGSVMRDYKRQTCFKTAENNGRFLVNTFGETENTTLWNGVTIEQMVAWLFEAQEKMNGLGLSYDPILSISLKEDLRTPRGRPSIGYMNAADGYNILHMTKTPEDNALMKSVAVHEYFHHAQARSKITGQKTLIKDTPISDWFIEGTARWFEDEVFDGENSYIEVERSGSKVLEVGLNAPHGSESNQRPYQRFSFFKLLNSKCSAFGTMYNEFNNNIDSTEPSGINNLLVDLLDASCDFGNQLGNDRKDSLEAALIYYQYATQYKNDMKLFDNDETGQGGQGRNRSPFRFVSSRTHYGEELEANGSIKSIKLDYIKKIPAYGAYSFKIDPSVWNGMLNRQEFAVRVELGSNSPSLTASIINESRFFNPFGLIKDKLDNLPHQHITPTTPNIGFGNFVSKFDQPFFITLVNPNSTDITISQIAIEVREIFTRGSNNIVTRTSNSLMWLDDAIAGVDKGTWANAHNYCDGLIHIGKDDWRLPTSVELSFLQNFVGKYDNYAFNNITITEGSPRRIYVSSTIRPPQNNTPESVYGYNFQPTNFAGFAHSVSITGSEPDYHYACVRDR